MLIDNGWLWFRVMKARYGVEGGRVKEGRSYGSAWWREMVMIRNGVSLAVGSKFDDNLRQKVRDGTYSFFFVGPMVGGDPFVRKVPRLFELS